LENKDETKGTLVPDNCSHKICVKCYTNIVLTSKNNLRCPQCRTPYLHKSEIVETEIDDYDEMPPLISLDDLFNINHDVTQTINVNSVNNSFNVTTQQTDRSIRIAHLWDIFSNRNNSPYTNYINDVINQLMEILSDINEPPDYHSIDDTIRSLRLLQ
jgi:hypothetical protein